MKPQQELFTARQTAETALYFPHIRVPETPWFTQVLLYWDKAATIVPEGSYREADIDPYMTSLKQVGLLEFVSPGEALNYRTHGTFDDVFIALLDSAGPPPQEHLRSYAKLHIDKMSYVLFHELQNRGLAQTSETEPDWWRIETSTANRYMGYLANVISGARPGTLPVTDRSDAFSTLGQGAAGVKRDVAKLRYAVITRALPAPAGPVEPRELMDFKEAHADELRRCRIHLDAKLAELTAIDDPERREIAGDLALEQIKGEIAALSKQMARKRWPRIGLGSFMGVSAGALTAGETLLAGGTALAVGFGVGAALLATGPEIIEAFGQAREPRFDRRAPFAYAALAGQRFG